MRRIERWWLPAFLGIYVFALAALSVGITIEYPYGLSSAMSALRMFHVRGIEFGVDARQAPVLWMALSPVIAAVYAGLGAAATIKACHLAMPLVAGALLWACHGLFSGLFSKPVAAVLVLLMAFNPLLIKNAPFLRPEIMSGLAVILFLGAARRYVESRKPRDYWRLFGAYLFATLCSYPLIFLMAGPLAYPLIAPGKSWSFRARGFFASPLWLQPALCALGCVLALGLVILLSGDTARGVVQDACHQLEDLVRSLLEAKGPSPWHVYAGSLGRQLGGLSALIVVGLGAWLTSREAEGRLVALCLLVPLAFMSLVLGNKEQAFALSLLVPLYAALGKGLETVASWVPSHPGRERVRLGLLAAFVLLNPWSETLRAADFLLREPSVHTGIFPGLAGLVEERVPETGCVEWRPGRIFLPARLEVVAQGDPFLVVGGSTLRFLARRRVREEGVYGETGDCVPALAIEPRDAPARKERWAAGPLARVYEGGRLGWEVFADGVRPAGVK